VIERQRSSPEIVNTYRRMFSRRVAAAEHAMGEPVARLDPLAFNHSPTGARPDGGLRSSQTKLGDQVGAPGEEMFQVTFGPQLDADGLVRLIVALDPIGWADRLCTSMHG
jgi:hypothetical protein